MSACFCVSAVMLGNGGVRSSRKRLPKRARWPPKFGALPKLNATFSHLAALTQQVLLGLETVKCSRSFRAVGNTRNTKLLPRAITADDRTWRALPSREGLVLAAAQPRKGTESVVR